ncbi:MAG: 3-dehydro-L-gulonate 2-dehydrogenase [bacterium]|nr:3-dehydro-L-gulonate 2-dehydrogenase [bacterium]
MRVSFEQLREAFCCALAKAGLSEERANLCGRLFAENQRDGVYSHGLNRFPGLMAKIGSGQIDVDAEALCVNAMGVVEQWDGRMGVGLVNAHHAMGRAIEIAQLHGMGCIGLKNTNHWMRAGAYGLQAADAGCIGMCWTNTTPLMPPWGATEKRIGNNPMVMAVPRQGGHLLLDMAMSQYSNGKLEILQQRGEALPLAGGYDVTGQLTCDPGAILASKRALPIGYWKGSALAVMLDVLAAVISGGQSTHKIGAQGDEYAVSQTFIALDVTTLTGEAAREQIVNDVVNNLVEAGEGVRYPGAGMLRTREESMRLGVRVDAQQWQDLLRMG